MDWLSDKFLHSKFEVIYSAKTSSSNNSSLLFDNDENLLTLMLESLKRDLKKTNNYANKERRGKNNEESKRFKDAGNKFFASKGDIDSLKRALELYTQSIAFAVPESESIALGYANRSAALLNLNRPKECLRDIESALKNNYPEKLKSKLHIRMAQCHEALAANCYADAKLCLKKVPVNDPSRKKLEETLKDHSPTEENGNIVDEECILPEFKPSSDYPCACDAVEVTHSKQYGRGLFATTRNINVGEVVACEKIYFKYLDPPNFYKHCANCMTFLLNGLPCDECVNFAYCSEKCKREAWVEYHQMECETFDLVQQYEICNVQWSQCVKLLIQFRREAGGLVQLIKRINDFGNFTDVEKTNVTKDWYQSSSMESVLCLMTHERTVKKSVLRDIIATTLRSLFFLATCTDFFDVKYTRDETDDVDILSSMAKNQDVVTIGKVLMALMLIIRYNSYTSTEDDSGEKMPKGTVTSPFISLMNHSCCPNVAVQFKRNHIVLYATLPVKKGEQIVSCYHVTYGREPKNSRQAFLRESFDFTCNCIACLNNWPVLNTSDVIGPLMRVEKIRSQSKLLRGVPPLMELTSKVLIMRNLQEKDKLLNQLPKMIEVLYQKVGLPSGEVHMVIDILNSIYSMTGNTCKVQSQFARK